MSKQRKGFTMAELMVVITIIVVLVGMVVVGYSVMGGSGKRNSTKAALETAKAMLAEIEASGGGQKIKSLYSDPQSGKSCYQQAAQPFPGSAAADNTVGAQAVFNPANASFPNSTTAAAFRALYSSQSNINIRDKLPSQRLALFTNPQDATDSVPVLLDGWGNPILFVPAGGLLVNLQGVGQKVVTSVGVFDPGTAVPATARPFFASAGADGDFSKGDDNIYSFEN